MHTVTSALIALVLMLGLQGCPAPMATTAVALGAAAHERAHGRCVAACTPGHVCNPATGFCDAIPCPNGCPAGQSCFSDSPAGPRCEPSGRLGLVRQR